MGISRPPVPTPFPQRVENFKHRTLPILVWSLATIGALFMLLTRSQRFEYIGEARVIEYEIAAKTPGRIETLAVDLFDAVDAGDVLAVLDDTPLRASLDTAQAAIERLEAELETE